MSYHPGKIEIEVFVRDVSCDQPTPDSRGQSFGTMSVRRRFDPYRVQREFPARWQAYIRASYRSIRQVTDVFNVSEKTARNWWTGATGANGSHVAIAVNQHPDQAATMLFAAE
jgi:hypothetical protein